MVSYIDSKRYWSWKTGTRRITEAIAPPPSWSPAVYGPGIYDLGWMTELCRRWPGMRRERWFDQAFHGMHANRCWPHRLLSYMTDQQQYNLSDVSHTVSHHIATISRSAGIGRQGSWTACPFPGGNDSLPYDYKLRIKLTSYTDGASDWSEVMVNISMVLLKNLMDFC